jgi:tRNA pseudouridine38-40 synthase
MRNIKLTLSYDGTDFSGWQTQPGFRTVQETVEQAIAKLTGADRVRLNASGRTDAGVHAVGQVANFFTDSRLAGDVLIRAVNDHLPDDVVVTKAEEAADAFDATRDATSKLYRYVIHDGAVPDPFQRRYACQSRWPLDALAMARAAELLCGRHDFHSFESHWPNRVSSVRTVTHLNVNRFGDYIRVEVEADGFLYNMARTIAGTLINVGRGYWPETKVAEILRAEDRTRAGPTAPAHGLFLMRVMYDEVGMT